jgi:hypothetical protein
MITHLIQVPIVEGLIDCSVAVNGMDGFLLAITELRLYEIDAAQHDLNVHFFQ